MRVAKLAIAACFALACGSPPDARRPTPEVHVGPDQSARLWSDAQHVFETRCVVCHGCYDAPCQLKLGSFEGIDRGATTDLVYDGTRLTAAAPTRLGTDAHGRVAWRDKNFHPVLPEGEGGDARASLLIQMLELKRTHPLLPEADIEAAFTLDLNRKQSCTDQAHFEDFAKEHPLWGMPYAFPGLTDREHQALVDWVRAGAPHSPPEKPSASVEAQLKEWEKFLNDGSYKGQLVGRYIYEHVFLASVRFEDANAPAGQAPPLFRLVRSLTLSGKIEEIATRRPFDDPKRARVYFRFQRRVDKPLEKTVMPYALGPARLLRFQKLFFETPYEVKHAPFYEPETAANPFRAFQALPVQSRYRFLLEEAELTMMGFIKGPVCRGQVALNVINDRFWIYFVDPAAPWHEKEAQLLAEAKVDLDMPAESGSDAFPTAWLGYGKAHASYVDKKAEFLERETHDGKGVTPAMIWDGDGSNDNAALTVFRHFDSATIEKGLIGPAPDTAWVVDYALLERIHYLLVAGFDVYGNVVHQLSTRLYMDFLRMEGETGFLVLLPPERRKALVERWYQKLDGEAKERVLHDLIGRSGKPDIEYKTATPELEAYQWLAQRVKSVARHDFDLARVSDAKLRAELERLSQVRGRAASSLPELSFVALDALDPSQGGPAFFTIVRDSAHVNVAELFHESDRRIPESDQLVAVPGLLGAYPNALFKLKANELGAFVDAVGKLGGPESYRALRGQFGVHRTDPSFWAFSDQLNLAHLSASPSLNGTFDYNRLEAY